MIDGPNRVKSLVSRESIGKCHTIKCTITQFINETVVRRYSNEIILSTVAARASQSAEWNEYGEHTRKESTREDDGARGV